MTPLPFAIALQTREVPAPQRSVSDLVNDRPGAERRLIRLGDRAIGPVGELLGTKDFDLRQRALRVLIKIGPEAAPRLARAGILYGGFDEPMLELLGGAEERTLKAVVDASLRHGRAGRGFALSTLGWIPKIRRRSALPFSRGYRQFAVDRLEKLFVSRDEEERARAIVYLAFYPEPALRMLTRRSSDRSESVRLDTIKATGKIHSLRARALAENDRGSQRQGQSPGRANPRSRVPSPVREIERIVLG